MTAVHDPGLTVRVTGRVDAPSRWLWTVKALLAVPHYPLIIGLYLIYPFTTIAAGLAILVTGRYPRGLFDFHLGVLRWSWRIMFYRFPMNGTDRYPPFTLAACPDYPARIDIDYPDRLPRGVLLVRWFTGLPQYLITWMIWPLFQFLVVVLGVGLLYTGEMPRGLYDFIMGIVRWRYRAAVYASLMCVSYPPFRMDQGPTEPDEES